MSRRKGGGQTAKPTPKSDEVLAWLIGKGWQTPKAIGEGTGITRNTVTVCLVTLKRRDVVDHVEGVWRAKTKIKPIYTGTLYDVLLPAKHQPRIKPCLIHKS
jgi:hypothetical protein